LESPNFNEFLVTKTLNIFDKASGRQKYLESTCDEKFAILGDFDFVSSPEPPAMYQ
jgi:hypothetical protein